MQSTFRLLILLLLFLHAAQGVNDFPAPTATFFPARGVGACYISSVPHGQVPHVMWGVYGASSVASPIMWRNPGVVDITDPMEPFTQHFTNSEALTRSWACFQFEGSNHVYRLNDHDPSGGKGKKYNVVDGPLTFTEDFGILGELDEISTITLTTSHVPETKETFVMRTFTRGPTGLYSGGFLTFFDASNTQVYPLPVLDGVGGANWFIDPVAFPPRECVIAGIFRDSSSYEQDSKLFCFDTANWNEIQTFPTNGVAAVEVININGGATAADIKIIIGNQRSDSSENVNIDIYTLESMLDTFGDQVADTVQTLPGGNVRDIQKYTKPDGMECFFVCRGGMRESSEYCWTGTQFSQTREITTNECYEVEMLPLGFKYPNHTLAIAQEGDDSFFMTVAVEPPTASQTKTESHSDSMSQSPSQSQSGSQSQSFSQSNSPTQTPTGPPTESPTPSPVPPPTDPPTHSPAPTNSPARTDAHTQSPQPAQSDPETQSPDPGQGGDDDDDDETPTATPVPGGGGGGGSDNTAVIAGVVIGAVSAIAGVGAMYQRRKKQNLMKGIAKDQKERDDKQDEELANQRKDNKGVFKTLARLLEGVRGNQRQTNDKLDRIERMLVSQQGVGGSTSVQMQDLTGGTNGSSDGSPPSSDTTV